MNEAGLDVQSLETAQTNGRGLLTSAYQMIGQLFADLNCDVKMMFSSITDLSSQSVNDRNILLYLATIESRVQQLLPAAKLQRQGGRETNTYVDDTTISWRIEHRKVDQPFHSPSNKIHATNHYTSINVDRISSIAPHVTRLHDDSARYGTADKDDRASPIDIVHSILTAYDDCTHRSVLTTKQPMPPIDRKQVNEGKS